MSLGALVGLALQMLTGHVDAAYLAAQADSVGVPREVAWAVAWQESGSGRRANAYRGPGTTTLFFGRDSLGEVFVAKRVVACREIGRMQLNPCTYRSSHARCTLRRVTESYRDNVFCGLRKLVSLRGLYGNWGRAVERYNGAGPMARAYRANIERYVGRLYLLTVTTGAS